jgi:hypothetical protein
MKRILIGGLVILGLVLGGCSSDGFYEETPVPSSSPTNEPRMVENPLVELPVEGKPPEDATWISPGKIQIGNFFPGARAEWPITIHNGNSYETRFMIAYRKPDYPSEGYREAPKEAQDWIIIVDPTPILASRETKEVLVALDIPGGIATEVPEKWEFWISVKDSTQSGMVKTELCSRWMVSMRS